MSAAQAVHVKAGFDGSIAMSCSSIVPDSCWAKTPSNAQTRSEYEPPRCLKIDSESEGPARSMHGMIVWWVISWCSR